MCMCKEWIVKKMYVTRPLSMYRRNASTMEVPTPDAPYSGYLVVTDEEAEAEGSFCWGLCQRSKVKRLPFPQDKVFTIVHSSDHYRTSTIKVVFIPVPDQPLSSNRYFVIRANGRYKGYVFIYICICMFTYMMNYMPWLYFFVSLWLIIFTF